jgi:hypothetical protein
MADSSEYPINPLLDFTLDMSVFDNTEQGHA